MCGIAGYWGFLPAQVASDVLQTMNTAQAHRGPDGEDVWIGPCVGFAHRRLAIVDLAGGRQPLASADQRYRIVFNGEIYNHKELRRELELAGYEFRTRADTEVIPAALDHWGIHDGLNRLRGMFAFAMYDSKERTLLLARDRVGIKPLYLGAANGLILFASEPKALLRTPFLPRRADWAALLDFFTLGVALSPRTCFADIREVRPGTWLRLTERGEEKGTYWEWRSGHDSDAMRRQNSARNREEISDLVDSLQECLAGSVKAHLESDVAVAAFLSGGIDSSVLVSLLCRSQRANISTFNVSFEEAAYDESQYARAVADRCGSYHREIRIQGGDGDPDLLKKILEQYDQPFGDSSSIPTWLICREMSRYNKAVISGDGGDEMFGGYDRYQAARDLSMLGSIPAGPALLNFFSHLLSARTPDLARQLRKGSEFARLPRGEMFCALHTYFPQSDMEAFFCPDFVRAANAQGPTWERLTNGVQANERDAAVQLMDVEIQSLLHADYLRKVDVASSAHGLEVRTPYLDTEVMDFAAKIPAYFKVRRHSPKHILRTLARRVLPHFVIDRPKQGFGIPFDRWAVAGMRDFLYDLLFSASSRSRDLLAATRTQGLVEAFCGSGNQLDLSRYQVYQRTFMLISFEVWLRKWSPSL